MILQKSRLTTLLVSGKGLFFTAIFLLLVGYWAVSVTINVVTVGRTLDLIEKTIDQQSYVLQQLTK